MKPKQIAAILDAHLCTAQVTFAAEYSPDGIGRTLMVCRTCGDVGVCTERKTPLVIHNLHQARKVAAALRKEARTNGSA